MAGDERRHEPLEENTEKANHTGTSGNREESMIESEKDAFGRGSTTSDPDSASQGDGSVEDPGEQDPRESGTTSLGGESSDSADVKGPGEVEGTS